MHLKIPRTWNGLLFLADVRNRADAELDIERPYEAHALDLWSPGRAALGPRGWKNTARLALFDHGDTVTSVKRAEALKVSRETIEQLSPRCTAVLQSRSATARRSRELDDEGLVQGSDGTACWALFKAPGSLSQLAGTVFDSALGLVIGIPNPVNQEYVFSWLTSKYLRRAEALADGAPVLTCPSAHWRPGKLMATALEAVLAHAKRGMPVSVDIESVPSTETLTCIGVSAGELAVAVPWDSYQDAAGTTPGVSDADRATVKAILETPCVKVGHNFIASDIPALATRGITLNGPLHDTLIMHGLCFPQFRHGLQYTAASLLAVPPWKSLYKPPCRSSAAGEYWAWNWEALGEYNCGDSWYTLKLYEELLWRTGMAA